MNRTSDPCVAGHRTGRRITKTKAGWDETAELKGPDSVVGDAFGYSVAASRLHCRRRCTMALLGYRPFWRRLRWVGTRASWKDPPPSLATCSAVRSPSRAPELSSAQLQAKNLAVGAERTCSPRQALAGANPPNEAEFRGPVSANPSPFLGPRLRSVARPSGRLVAGSTCSQRVQRTGGGRPS
jgi:hypothetical protein